MVTAVGITGVGIIMQQDKVVVIADATPTPSPTALPIILHDAPVVLFVQDGKIVFYDQPSGDSHTLTVEKNTLVEARLIGETRVGNVEWFRLEVPELQSGGGWVMSDEMTIYTGPAYTFDSFVFSAGTAAGPVGPSGSSLALPFDGLWLEWEYAGLKEGDVVQRTLWVNGEQYGTKPITWSGPSEGRQLVNLIDEHNPRVEAGIWTVEFIVNGETVTETTVQIRAE